VQRANIALREKGDPFAVVYIDLLDKPDWFLELSPLGKVPVLRVERPGLPDAAIFESAAIIEYIEETVGGRPLHPADPVRRAQHRGWIEVGSTLLSDFYRLSSAKEGAELDAAREALDARLTRVEQSVAGRPFFDGPDFSYVDAAFAPAFRQIDVLETVTRTGLLDRHPALVSWNEALQNRPSVRDAVPDDFTERYLERLRQQEAVILKQAA
jgi:glutathione S-transferase